MDSILPAAVQWRRDKFDFTPHLARGMLAHHRSLLDSVLSEDTGDIGRYVDLGAVREAYRRMAARGERADGYDVQAVWRPRRRPCGCASSAAWRPMCRRRLARCERDG
jgi:asparagine synthase (glutamine-hydrolysing)